VNLRSLGLRTDAMFAAYDGAVIDRGDYVVVSTPVNPTFFWGNLLVFQQPPTPTDLAEDGEWMRLYARELPRCEHRAFTWDRVDGDTFDAQPFHAAGFMRDGTHVMRLDAPLASSGVTVRRLERGSSVLGQWQRIFALLDGCFTPEGARHDRYQRFLRIQVDRYASMIASGFGMWFAIDEEGEPIATCGIFPHEECWRYQLVAVRADRRGRGLASALVAEAGRLAREARPSPLVIGCVAGSSAERIYSRLGFTTLEHTVGLMRSG
jgi:GNAT superfamily N-acetyltransferase